MVFAILAYNNSNDITKRYFFEYFCIYKLKIFKKMNLNKNDYVDVNGKRYYAVGGVKGTKKINPTLLKNHFKAEGRQSNFSPKTHFVHSNNDKTKDAGQAVYNSYPENVRALIDKKRGQWADFIENEYGKDYLNSIGIDIDAYRDIKNNDYSSDVVGRVNGLMHKRFPNQIIGNDSGDNDIIKAGGNVFHSMLSTELANEYSKEVPSEWEYLNSQGLDAYKNDQNKTWSRHVLPDNTVNYNFYDIADGNGPRRHKTAPISLVYDPSEDKWSQYVYNKNDLGPATEKFIEDIGNNPNHKVSSYRNAYKNRTDSYPIIYGNSKGIGFSNGRVEDGVNVDQFFGVDPTAVKQNAYGGRVNRPIYYADGGAMGMIPMGEQPEDYNMVGAGGSHEQNPMGGVPYGVNQDGSQNMVEQGEVSMGNDVFSDRTQLSPELCQQLGLPEGISPAQAMQQIEQLYEQGQISEDELKEVQQIIFQDQEMQKQNMGGSYQQGQVGGPGVQNEGIDPNMGMPMDPMAMQQGQNEGITPDMIQGGY